MCPAYVVTVTLSDVYVMLCYVLSLYPQLRIEPGPTWRTYHWATLNPNKLWHIIFRLAYFIVRSTEYWMIYRGPVFLAVVWFGSSPTPLPPSVSKISQPFCVSTIELTDGREGKGWESSQTTRQWESLVLYISLNTLCMARRLTWSITIFGLQKTFSADLVFLSSFVSTSRL